MFNVLKKIISKYPKNRGELLDNNADRGKASSVVCPNCGGSQWYEGPSGGMSTNYKCANPRCGLWYNATPFGLEFIGVKDNIGEHRIVQWYCKGCDTLVERETSNHHPNCHTCGTKLVVCWTYDVPDTICETCGDKFECFTTRGNN